MNNLCCTSWRYRIPKTLVGQASVRFAGNPKLVNGPLFSFWITFWTANERTYAKSSCKCIGLSGLAAQSTCAQKTKKFFSQINISRFLNTVTFTGYTWRLASRMHLNSLRLIRATEWSAATEQIQLSTRGWTNIYVRTIKRQQILKLSTKLNNS